MNQKLKYVGLLATLPLFIIALSAGYIGEADAGNISSFCQHHTCSATSHQPHIGDADKVISAEMYSIHEIGETWYQATFFVYNDGDQNLLEVKLFLTSDLSSKEILVPTLFAQSHTEVTGLIQADDPRTIDAELIESYRAQN